jgi:mRNA interferase RelE/StbE
MNRCRVALGEDALDDIRDLPVTIRARFEAVITRLEAWPEVSGARPLRGKLKGHYRIRMGDWRVVFKLVETTVVIVRIAHRSAAYKD